MTVRSLVAGPWRMGLSAWRAVTGWTPPAGAFRILLLHDVPPARVGRLERLLDRIAQGGGFIAPDEALARLETRAPPRDAARHPPWLVTFDDGFASNRVVAESVLAPRGIRAVFFVCPALLDLPADRQGAAAAQYIHDGAPGVASPSSGAPLMGWDDLAALVQGGHVVGGHTLRHRRLTRVRGDALEEEVGESMARLSLRLGQAADWFAYPFGDIDSIDATALAVVGRHCRVCRSGVRGLNRPGDHRLALHADHVDLDDAASWQELILAGGLDSRYADARRRLAAMAAVADHHPAP